MVETLVLDASVGLAIATPEEAGHATALECFAQMGAAGALFVTTPFYAYEAGNALSRARRKDGLDARFHDVRALAAPVEPTEASLTRALAIAAS